MGNFKIVISQVVNKNNMWYVEACVDLREIMQKDKKLFKFITKQKDLYCYENGLMSIDNLIDALTENKKFYNKYKSFIKNARKQQHSYEDMAYDVYKLCRSIHKYGKRMKFEEDTTEEVVNYINYICDRSLIQGLEVHEMCMVAWDYIVNGIKQACKIER